MAYNTGNPVGSRDPRDFLDNSEITDEWVTSTSKTSHPDRLGRPRKTWHGMEQDHGAAQAERAATFSASQAEREQAFQAFLTASGYVDLGDYGAGIELTARNQLLLKDGAYWRLHESVPLPYTTTGSWAGESGNFVSTERDAPLRQELVSQYGARLVGNAVIYADSVAELVNISSLPIPNGLLVAIGDFGLFSWDQGAGKFNSRSKFSLPEMYPSLIDGDDYSDALIGSSLSAKDRNVTWLLSGQYRTSKQVTVPSGVHVQSMPGSKIFADGASFETQDNAVVFFGSKNKFLLPSLSVDPTAGAITITFSAAHGLAVGDVFVIFNPSDFSYLASRAYYKQGEFCRVAELISPTEVKLDAPLVVSQLSSDVECWYLDVSAYSFDGRFGVHLDATGMSNKSIAAIRMVQLCDTDISGIKAEAIMSTAAISLSRCVNIQGGSVNAQQSGDSGTGTDYGLVIGNSQSITLSGKFCGRRHGATTGGSAEPPCAPNRWCDVRGEFSNLVIDGSLGAANWHGNSEFCSYGGVIRGGAGGGGNHNSLAPGTKVYDEYCTIYMGEMKGWDFDFSFTEHFVSGDPLGAIGRGAIDVGGNSFASSDFTTEGGVFSLNGGKIYHPKNAGFAVRIRDRGCPALSDVVIDARGFRAVGAKELESIAHVSISNVSAVSQFSLVDLVDADGLAKNSVNAGDYEKINEGSVSGQIDEVQLPLDSSSALFTVEYGKTFNKIPKVDADIKNMISGSSRLIVGTSSIGLASAVIRVISADGNNFTADNPTTLYWRASVDNR